MNRRNFLKTAAAAGIVSGLPLASRAAERAAFKTKLQKALIAGVADDATCERIAKAGFPGMELQKKTSPSNRPNRDGLPQRNTASKSTPLWAVGPI